MDLDEALLLGPEDIIRMKHDFDELKFGNSEFSHSNAMNDIKEALIHIYKAMALITSACSNTSPFSMISNYLYRVKTDISHVHTELRDALILLKKEEEL